MPSGGPVPVLARLLLIVVMVGALPASAGASPEDDLARAQREANAAAADLSAALEDMARADDALNHVQNRVAGVERRLEAVRDQVRQLAIRLYVEGTSTLSRLLRMSDANQLVRAQQFGHVLAGASTDSLRQYRVDRDDLREELLALERKQDERADALENLRRRQSDVVQELDRLTRVAEQARAAERARAEAAAPSGNTDQGPSVQRSRDEASSAQPGSASSTAAPATEEPRGPAPTPAPAPAAAPAIASGGWICPVQGPHAFSNDWGAARGGGYSHQGNDILAAKGTPVVASVSGYVSQRNGAVSGLAYWLEGDDGNTYFGAHLYSFGASGRVTAGTQVGTVGNTGDAAGGPPHLHFEIRPGGGSPVNPYPTLTRYC